jgi:hypothetical protein
MAYGDGATKEAYHECKRLPDAGRQARKTIQSARHLSERDRHA